MAGLAGIIPQGHMNFGSSIADAMNSMWNVNSANQQASLASQAIGGRGVGGGDNGSLWNAYLGFNLANPNQSDQFRRAKGVIRSEGDLDFQNQLKQEQARRDMMFNDWNRRGFGTMLSGMFGGGNTFNNQPGGGAVGYNTNFGASGYVG
jgi:hypothetical protein